MVDDVEAAVGCRKGSNTFVRCVGDVACNDACLSDGVYIDDTFHVSEGVREYQQVCMEESDILSGKESSRCVAFW